MTLAGVVFDLDDTLTDYSTVEARMWAATADAVRAVLPGIDAEAARRRFVALREPLFERILSGEITVDEFRRTQLTQTVEPWGTVGEDVLAEHCAMRDALIGETIPMEGAHALLADLRARGLRIGVLTNGSHEFLERKLDALGIADDLDAVVSAVDAGHPKPEPAAYAATAEALGLAPAALAMVGDHLVWDVIAPLQAGYSRGVWLDRGAGIHDAADLPSGTAVRVASLAEVPAALGLERP